jgi:GT2 family glycosyltransferase
LAGHVSEDQEWCLRARDLGYRIGYAPASVVGHPARKTWPDLLRKWRRVNSERYGLMTRSGRGRWRWLILTCALPASAFVHTHKALLSKKLGGLGQRLAAVGVLHKLRWWRLGDSLRLLRDKDR